MGLVPMGLASLGGASSGSAAERLVRPLILVIAVVASLVAVFGLSSPAAAQDDEGPDAEFDSRVVALTARYQIEPDQQRVVVNETITIRNVRGSTRSGNIRTDYFWTGHTVWAAFDAENLTVSSNGAELTFEQFDEVDDLVKIYSVDFPTNLNFGQTRVLEVSYELPSYQEEDGPRRINGAFFNLELVTCCNFEEITIEVTAPTSFSIDPPRDVDFTKSLNGSTQLWSYYDSELSGDFTDFVIADWFGTDFDGFEETTIALGGATATTFGYPDDAAWNREVPELVSGVATSMQRLTNGNRWRQPDPTFVQASDDADDLLAEFGVPDWDTGDPTVSVATTVPHWAVALSVARPYVADSNFAIDWMTESTVRDMASRSLDEVLAQGGPEPSEPSGRVTSARDGGFWFLRQITDDIGYEGLLELERLASTSETAFVGDAAPEQSVTIANDWRRLLDLGERRLDMADLASLLESSVLRDDEVRELRERTATIDRFDELRARVAIDEGPIGMRDGLTNWQFGAVNDMIDAADRALDEAEDIAALAEAAELRFDADVLQGWTDLASLSDFEALSDGFDAQRDAIAAIEAAQRRLDDERSYVTSLGFDAAAATDSLAQARAAFDDGDLGGVDASLAQLAAIEDDASAAGRSKLILRIIASVAVGVLLLLGLGLFLRKRRARNQDGLQLARPLTPESAPPQPHGSTEVHYPSAPPIAAPQPAPATPIVASPSPPPPAPLPSVPPPPAPSAPVPSAPSPVSSAEPELIDLTVEMPEPVATGPDDEPPPPPPPVIRF